MSYVCIKNLMVVKLSRWFNIDIIVYLLSTGLLHNKIDFNYNRYNKQ